MPTKCALCQGHQRKCAAFTVIVGSQEEQYVFYRDDEDQRPNNQRQDTENDFCVGGFAQATCRQDRLTQSVEWARADIAINDSDTAEREGPKVPALKQLGMGAAIRNGSLQRSARHAIWPYLEGSDLTAASDRARGR